MLGRLIPVQDSAGCACHAPQAHGEPPVPIPIGTKIGPWGGLHHMLRATTCMCFEKPPLKRKKRAEALFSTMCRLCTAVCTFTYGAGNESCTRALSLCFPITFSTVLISEELNYSLVFRPRQQSSSSGIHQRPRTFQPPRRCTRTHPAPSASTCGIATATEAGTDPR